MQKFCFCVVGRSMESGCSMWGRGTNQVWKVTWCQWAAPGWNCLLPPTAESSPSTGPTACEHTHGCKWSDIVAVHFFSCATEEVVCLLVSQLSSCLPLPLSHYRSDKCLQGIANATISGMTSHTTCMYFALLPCLSLFHPERYAMWQGWCTQSKSLCR